LFGYFSFVLNLSARREKALFWVYFVAGVVVSWADDGIVGVFTYQQAQG
jgi:hypothetical protein